MKTQRIPIHETTFEALAELGHEVGDDGAGERALYASLVRRNLLSRLTPRQRQVIICLGEQEMTRKQAALHLIVGLQSIHQIVARIKERFPESDERRVRNLAWFYWLIYPTADARVISSQWRLHPVLRDYPKPADGTLLQWYQRYRVGKEVYGGTKTASN